MLDKTSALPISLVLIDGKTLATIGDAGAYLSRLSAEQLATRIISEQAMIPSERIRRGKITEEEFA